MAKRGAQKQRTVDATLNASRALLGVVARSVAPVLEHVSLAQFRVLVLLAEHGPTRSGQLAGWLGVHPSTFTRMADRLVSGGWVTRQEAPGNRREVHVALTASGAGIVAEVIERRRTALQQIIGPLNSAQREAILLGLETFAEAAGEPDLQDLSTLGL